MILVVLFMFRIRISFASLRFLSVWRPRSTPSSCCSLSLSRHYKCAHFLRVAVRFGYEYWSDSGSARRWRRTREIEHRISRFAPPNAVKWRTKWRRQSTGWNWRTKGNETTFSAGSVCNNAFHRALRARGQWIKIYSVAINNNKQRKNERERRRRAERRKIE